MCIRDRWISIFLQPEAATMEKESGLFRVICYGSSATIAFNLVEEVKSFLDNEVIDGLSFSVGYGDGLGVINLENGIYQTVVLFDIIVFNINCKKD